MFTLRFEAAHKVRDGQGCIDYDAMVADGLDDGEYELGGYCLCPAKGAQEDGTLSSTLTRTGHCAT